MLERSITLRVRTLPRRAAAWLAVIAMSSFMPAVPIASAAAAVDRVHFAAGAANNTPDAATDRKPERQWVTHTIVPRETLDEIAARYDVKPSEVQSWNKKALGSSGLKAGRDLRILARRLAPPRKKIKYTVIYGDTWGEIAAKYNIDADDLRAWNRSVPKQFKAGQAITVYTNPRPPKVVHIDPNHLPGPDDVAVGLQPDALPVIDVPKGGVSIGRPTRGRLYNGVQLPETEYYDVRRPEEAWGSSHTVETIQVALATFRRDSGYDGKIIVASLSKQNGGRFRPHRSHQSGRDADIRLPKKRGADLKSDDPNDIDWDASWKMIDAFIETGEVEYIFLDYSRQKRLYDAARKAGAKSDELEKAIQYPRARKTNNGAVRHAEGHMVHIHVRIECPDNQARCES